MELTEFLEHHGVKGMKWGVRRKDRSPQGRADKLQRVADRRPTRGNVRTAQRAQIQATRKQSRKERRLAEHEAKVKEGQKRAMAMLKHASKNPNDLFLVNGHTVVTGKEFVDHLALGGLLNVKTSGIYAVKTKQGYARVPPQGG